VRIISFHRSVRGRSHQPLAAVQAGFIAYAHSTAANLPPGGWAFDYALSARAPTLRHAAELLHS
jgi:hypothetical protein